MARAGPRVLFRRPRGRRGVLSVVGLSSLLVLAGALQWASENGALTGPSLIGTSHLVSAAMLNESVTVNDTVPGFYPSQIVVSAGVTVNFNITNTDTIDHTFTVYSHSGTTIACAGLSSQQLDRYFSAANDSLVNDSLAPGQSVLWTVNFTGPGTYQILSLTPDQCQAGLTGFLHVLPAGSKSVQYAFVNATGSLTFVPSILEIVPQVPVQFVVGYQGTTHTFTLVSCSNDTNITAGVALPTNDGCLNNPLVNSGDQSPGNTWVSPPTIIKAGIYWYVCEIPGHFQAGMFGHVYVGITPTPPASLPSVQNVLQLGVLLLIATVVGGAAFLVLMGMSERVELAPGSRGGTEPASHH